MRLAKPLPRSLSDIPVADLLVEIRRRERLVAKLRREHVAIGAKLDRLERQIADMGDSPQSQRSADRGTRGGGIVPRRRLRDELPLHTALHAALKGKAMTAGEAAEAVLRFGYKTTSSNFRQVVALTFLKHKDLFKRVARGEYTARQGRGAHVA